MSVTMKPAREETEETVTISLKAARISAGLTMEQAAAAFGVTRRRLKIWEDNPGEINLKYLPKIEKLYGYPLRAFDFCN